MLPAPTAACINTPQTETPPPPPLAGQPPIMPSMAAELGRVCMGLGMGPPEFAFLRHRQVGLSNNLFSSLSDFENCNFSGSHIFVTL